MKTNYLKSIALVLLGSLITNLVMSSKVNKPYLNITDCGEVPYSPNLDSALAPFIDTSLHVDSSNCELISTSDIHKECMNEAIESMAIYRLWLKYIPHCVKLNEDKGQLEFKPIKLKSKIDSLVISQTIESYKESYCEGTDCEWIPFTGTRNHAINISRASIDSAFADAENNSEIKDNINGIRVYLGITDGLNNLDPNKLSSHLYVVPTYLENGLTKDYIPSINSEENSTKYVYDLTTPCPAHCDFESPLNLLRYQN